MKYFVTIDDQEHAIDVEVRPNGELVVSLDGHVYENDVIVLDDDALSVRIDGRVLDLTVEGSPPDVGVIASGHRAYVKVESDRLRAARAARRGGAGGGEKAVSAPMPGRVVKVLVAVGDEVKAGQGVVVIEAMKMENELKAKGPGKVAEIHVKPGEAIESGARLISFG
jgi:biotin carboxyl carrier protein